MACRMLIAVGKFPVDQLLDGFKLMALNENEKHEKNRDNPNYIHDDGWGIVLGKSGNLIEIYKRAVPCWKDPKFMKYYDANVDFILVHARRASNKKLGRNLTLTHPFEREGWCFCHNGTVSELEVKGESDSERFFALLMANMKQQENVKDAIETTVKNLKKYTALNFILVNARANNALAYILVKYQKNPNYYTMKFFENKDHIIVSSEVLPNFKGEWKRIKNATLLEIPFPQKKALLHSVA